MPRRALLPLSVVVALLAAGLTLWILAPSAFTRENRAASNQVGNEDVRTNGNGPARNSAPRSNTDGETPSTNRSNSPPSNTGEPQHPLPDVPKIKVRQRTVSEPPLDWKLSATDCRRIENDPASTTVQRGEAAARLMLSFPDWPGRDATRLGGYVFDPASYPELAKFKRLGDDHVTVLCDESYPSIVLERKVVVGRERLQLDLTIKVLASIGWAQRFFLDTALSTGRVPGKRAQLGHERGVHVGDVCAGDAEDKPQAAAWLAFSRHNVNVSMRLWTHPGDDSELQLNLVALAQRMDREIVSQSHTAANLDELNKFRPVIDEFYYDPDSQQEREKDFSFSVVYSAHHPEEKKFTVFTNQQIGGWLAVKRNPTVSVLKDRAQQGPYKAWLVAYDESLLFSIAEIAVLVKPK